MRTPRFADFGLLASFEFALFDAWMKVVDGMHRKGMELFESKTRRRAPKSLTQALTITWFLLLLVTGILDPYHRRPEPDPAPSLNAQLGQKGAGSHR